MFKLINIILFSIQGSIMKNYIILNVHFSEKLCTFTKSHYDLIYIIRGIKFKAHLI